MKSVNRFANSTYDQKVLGSNLGSSKILEENGVQVMPGLILAPNSGSFENKKNTVSQMGHTKKSIKRVELFFII